MADQTGFVFVIPGPGGIELSKETRTKIRKQAMRSVGAARRQHARPGRYNRRQCPPEDAQAVDISTRLIPSARVVEVSWGKSRKTAPSPHADPASLSLIPRPMPLSGISRLARDTGVSPIDFSTLGRSHATHLASTLLSSSRNDLATLLSFPSWSYFYYIPSQVGYSACLDDAVQCLMGKARLLLGPAPDGFERGVLCSYGRALRSLQAAVDDASLRNQAVVLCATEVLSLFELLDCPSSSATWRQHMRGALRLVQIRGPSRFKTDFEKALLIALIGPMICESFLLNQELFVDDDRWREVLTSALTKEEALTDRSPLAIELNIAITRIPGYSKRVTHIICHEDSPTESAIDSVEKEGRQLRRLFRKWRARFDLTVVACPEQEHNAAGWNRDKRFEMLGTALAMSALLARCVAALCSSHEEAERLEAEAQAATAELIELHKYVCGKDLRVAFYLAQKAKVGGSFQRTADIFPGPKRAGGRLTERWRFERWCDEVPRSHSAKGCCA